MTGVCFCIFEDGVDVRLEEVGDCACFLRGPALSLIFHFGPGVLEGRFILAAVCEEGLVDELPVMVRRVWANGCTLRNFWELGKSIQINVIKLEFLQRTFY